MLASFTKKDPPPHRVKPIPIAVLRIVSATASASQCPSIQQATANMIILAFFFLLQPGEYTAKATTVPIAVLRNVSDLVFMCDKVDKLVDNS